MAINKTQLTNILLVLAVVLLIVPQFRMAIQVGLNKGVALIRPIKLEETPVQLNSYEFTLSGINSEQTLAFKSLQNKVIVFNVWATWCPSCIAEMQSLQDLYTDYKDDVAFVMLALDENPNKVIDFLESNAYTLPVYASVAELPELLTTNTIPRTLVIDKNGQLIFDVTGAANWNSTTVREKLNALIN